MKPAQKLLFDKNLLNIVAQRFGVIPESVKPLGGFENYVCDCKKNGSPYIIRISHHTHRSPDQIKAELDWVKFLADNSVKVCLPLELVNNSLTEVIENESGLFTSVMFEKAKGGPVKGSDMNDEMVFNRGKLIGQIHRLTKAYNPSPDITRRPEWYEDDDYLNYDKYLLPEDKLIRTRLESLVEQLRKIPTDADSYDLIHQDAHSGNIFFDNNQPTLFDFDDCSYDFLVSDIAISLFYALLGYTDETERKEYAHKFLEQFLAGYCQENQLSNHWLEMIPLILKRREIILYVAINRAMDLDKLDEFCTQYLAEHKIKIEEEIPYLDIDFTALS